MRHNNYRGELGHHGEPPALDSMIEQSIGGVARFQKARQTEFASVAELPAAIGPELDALRARLANNPVFVNELPKIDTGMHAAHSEAVRQTPARPGMVAKAAPAFPVPKPPGFDYN